MTAAQGRLNLIYAGRAVAGLGMGATSLTVPVYIAETAPPSIRGRLIGVFEIASQGGGMAGLWIAYATDQTIDVRSQAQWVIPLALQLLPGVLLLSGIFWCPESPRWLARKDNFDEAQKVLCWIRNMTPNSEYIQNEMASIREQVQERSKINTRKIDQVKKLFEKGTRNRMAIGTGLMFLQSCKWLSLRNLTTCMLITASYWNQHHYILRTAYLRILRHPGHFPSSFLHWFLRYCQDHRNVYLHLLGR